MANNQNLHPNNVSHLPVANFLRLTSQCASSNVGHFGSKFVSIVVLGSVFSIHAYDVDDEEGRPHLKGFQMSNEFCQMVQEEIIKVSRKDSNSFVVLKSKRKYDV